MNGLEVRGLSYRYGPRQALKEVSFSVPKGRFCALLGPNGAGKSTLFNLLTALFTAPEGQIMVAGVNLSQEPRRALARMGVVFQQPTLDLDLTVRRNMLYFAALHGISGSEAARRCDAALEQLGMGERAAETVRALNGGHRRRMEIARALIHRPEVLLLDEPTVGLDAASRAAITDHVHALADQGLSVLWATHLTDEVQDNDLTLLLHKGVLLAQDTAANLRQDQSLQDAFLRLTGGAVQEHGGGGLR
ncbi:ABC transporter ATP-binding protein [Pseudotabrizicola algicola]|uniref:ATP-binding cassette domain-containing protein n=1 Tax=Pseudotabrizicola algicola TaxID=2709381 RepID=A0A6B3RXU4_9RHOB|nr:ABC transporter ATP-binding protein [Pseudotabrizicola algicola]NEX47939.1 ATP-binding cassette domain-containing protein [Pseudotabrizicola algicola]